MPSPQSITARNELGSLLEDYPKRATKITGSIDALATEIAALQGDITNDTDGLYEPGDIGLLNQVRADVKSALQQAAAAI